MGVYTNTPNAGDIMLSEGGFTTLMDSGELPAFMSRNSREIREPEIFACARALRGPDHGFKKVGASGYCYGGWACFRLASAEHDDPSSSTSSSSPPPPLVDAISVGHPTFLTKEDIDQTSKRVAVQMLAPEVDAVYTAELKAYTFTKLQELGVSLEYRHFPGVAHACFIRGDVKLDGEREAMVKGKNAAVNWYREWLHGVTE